MFLNLLQFVPQFHSFYVGLFEYYVKSRQTTPKRLWLREPHPKKLWLRADRGSHARPYTVPTTEKNVESAKTVHDPTPRYRPYRTPKTTLYRGLACGCCRWSLASYWMWEGKKVSYMLFYACRCQFLPWLLVRLLIVGLGARHKKTWPSGTHWCPR